MRGGGATAFQSERPNITFRVMYDLPGTNGLSGFLFAGNSEKWFPKCRELSKVEKEKQRLEREREKYLEREAR